MMSIDPVVLFFLLGFLAGLARTELRLPPAIYDFISVLLLLSIGLKGGVELARQPLLSLVPGIVGVIIMGIAIALMGYPVLRFLGKMKRADAASIAAHYGSVSVGTYAVAVSYLATRQIAFEEYMPLFLVVLEIPAIIVGVLLARGISRNARWGQLSHEVLLGKSIVLLLGGLLIGWIAGPANVESIQPLFFDLFKGILALFLLEMGLIAAAQVGALRRHGLFIVLFGVLMPLASSLLGAALGSALGLSTGGIMILATMAASASYIAVPAAMRLTVPEANPTLSLTASLGVTFPFNILLGVPLYLQLAYWIHGIGGG